MPGDDVSIERVGAERIDDLGPLYLALHEHHAAIAPALASGAARGVEESWRRQRRGCGERIGEVHDIALLPQARGGGLGTELLALVAAELAAAGVSHYRLLEG